jgi:hypothetical protein
VRETVLTFLMAVLSAGIGLAENTGSGLGTEGFDQLEKRKGAFKTTLIRPDAGFASYSKLAPKEVLLQFRGPKPAQDESTAGSLVRRRSRGPEIPEGDDLETLRRVINDAIASELGNSELFEVVQDAGSGTLVVRAIIMDVITDIVSKSEKGGDKPKPFKAQGEIVFDVIDAETGVIQARFGERSRSTKSKGVAAPPDVGAQWADVWRWAEGAAAELRRELERVYNEDRSATPGAGASLKAVR